ncbi:predicted protein [Botrytis cinerea T4]|uniref:Uncharacterized protein n=1 Tax=Botryotinia fuckeliana (strain T4) TaxID=999810 RepID=G2YBZ6_BOTF4|nr:predicted protein [Botrytis cinerea T4]
MLRSKVEKEGSILFYNSIKFGRVSPNFVYLKFVSTKTSAQETNALTTSIPSIITKEKLATVELRMTKLSAAARRQ